MKLINTRVLYIGLVCVSLGIVLQQEKITKLQKQIADIKEEEDSIRRTSNGSAALCFTTQLLCESNKAEITEFERVSAMFDRKVALKLMENRKD